MSDTHAPASEVRVSPATEVPVEALNAFYRKMVPDRAEFLVRNWRWLYRVGRGGTAPLVALIGEEVVGHAGLIPVTLRAGGTEREAIWFIDFWILPELQRRGIGTALTNRWMAMCPLHITFCNDQSIGVFRKLGWREHFGTVAMRLLLRPEKHPGVRRRAALRVPAAVAGVAIRAGARLASARAPTLRAEPVSEASLAPFVDLERAGVGVPRTPEFLRWRVLEHPEVGQHRVLRAGGDAGPAALVRIFDEGGFRRLHLLSVTGTGEPRALRRFFAGVIRWALGEGIDHVWMISSDPEVVRVARRYLPMTNRPRFAFHADDSQATALLGTSGVWEAIDSDLDLALHARVRPDD